MPLYDFLCAECGNTCEILVTSSASSPICTSCGSDKLKKMLSAPSSLTGSTRQGMPGPGDSACCGSTPSHAGCAGPGSCCGKGPH